MKRVEGSFIKGGTPTHFIRDIDCPNPLSAGLGQPDNKSEKYRDLYGYQYGGKACLRYPIPECDNRSLDHNGCTCIIRPATHMVGGFTTEGFGFGVLGCTWAPNVGKVIAQNP